MMYSGGAAMVVLVLRFFCGFDFGSLEPERELLVSALERQRLER